jgi:hypothetical protein
MWHFLRLSTVETLEREHVLNSESASLKVVFRGI